mmetsp:Transcript_51103/g.143902  ORF Transcript_51103/g.143902 Transcript_51103/m.143902 type:complete len:461 (+) Transcript_51103:63-1445(+)
MNKAVSVPILFGFPPESQLTSTCAPSTPTYGHNRDAVFRQQSLGSLTSRNTEQPGRGLNRDGSRASLCHSPRGYLRTRSYSPIQQLPGSPYGGNLRRSLRSSQAVARDMSPGARATPRATPRMMLEGGAHSQNSPTLLTRGRPASPMNSGGFLHEIKRMDFPVLDLMQPHAKLVMPFVQQVNHAQESSVQGVFGGFMPLWHPLHDPLHAGSVDREDVHEKNCAHSPFLTSNIQSRARSADVDYDSDGSDASCRDSWLSQKGRSNLMCCGLIAGVILVILSGIAIYFLVSDAPADHAVAASSPAPLVHGAGAAPGVVAAGAAPTKLRNGAEAKKSKSLTDHYIQARMTNDLATLRELCASDIHLRVNLDNAGMLVSMKVKSALEFRTDRHGVEDVARYFEALPTEPDDAKPTSDMIKCIGSTCTVRTSLQRPFVGTVTDSATLTWDTQQELLVEEVVNISA